MTLTTSCRHTSVSVKLNVSCSEAAFIYRGALCVRFGAIGRARNENGSLKIENRPRSAKAARNRRIAGGGPALSARKSRGKAGAEGEGAAGCDRGDRRGVIAEITPWALRGSVGASRSSCADCVGCRLRDLVCCRPRSRCEWQGTTTGGSEAHDPRRQRPQDLHWSGAKRERLPRVLRTSLSSKRPAFLTAETSPGRGRGSSVTSRRAPRSRNSHSPQPARQARCVSPGCRSEAR